MNMQEMQSEAFNKRLRERGTYPKYAFWMATIGGMLIFIEGLMAIFFRSIVWAIAVDFWIGITWVFIGVMLVIAGLIVSSSAVALVMRPKFHVVEGASIILFSTLAIFFGGGYIIGSVLGIIGGVLAILWRQKAS
jgi:hypothetical protein